MLLGALLHTDPLVSTPPDKLSYSGCAIILEGIPVNSNSAGTQGSVNCSDLFDESCTNAIYEIVSSNITALVSATLSAGDICGAVANILDTVPNECKSWEWNSVAATRKPSSNTRSTQLRYMT